MTEKSVKPPPFKIRVFVDGLQPGLDPDKVNQLLDRVEVEELGTSEAVPVHDWQREELTRRKANLIQNPSSGLSWEEVKRRVRGRYRGSSVIPPAF